MKFRNQAAAAVSFLLSALLLLSGCGAEAGTPQTAAETNASGNAAAAEDVETTEAPSEYTAPDVDFEGADFTFATYDAENRAACFFSDHYDGIFSEGENGDSMNDAIYRRNCVVEEELNITIQNIPWNGDSSFFTKAVLAGDNVFDAAIDYQVAMADIVKAGELLVNLNDIETLDLAASWWNEAATKEYSIGNYQFTTTGDLCLYFTAAIGSLYFNKEMVESYGLDSPYQLVDDGKWTIDALTSMCTSVSQDLNGNGEVDPEDRFGLSGSKTCMAMLMYGAGIRVATKNADGVPEFTMNTERMQTVVEKGVNLLRSKANTMYVGDFSGDVTYSVFVPAFVDNRLLFHFNWVFMSYELRDMQANFGIVMFPKFDEKQDAYHSYNSSGYTTTLLVPLTNSRTEMTGHVLNAMGYYSQQLITPTFIDSTVTGKLMRDDDSARMLEIMIHSKIFELYDLFTWGKLGSIPGDCCEKKSTDFASVYASKIDAAEAELQATYEQYQG